MIAVAIVVGVVLIYALGRSHGRDKVKNEIRDIFNDQRKGRQ